MYMFDFHNDNSDKRDCKQALLSSFSTESVSYMARPLYQS